MRRAGALSDEVFVALVEETFTGRTEGELACGSSGASVKAGAESVSLRRSSERASPRPPHGDPSEQADRVRAPSSRSTRAASSTGTARTAADVRRRRGWPSGSTRSTRSASRHSSPGSRRSRPASHGRDADAAARKVTSARGSRRAYAHGLHMVSGLQIHEAPTLRPNSTDARAGKHRLGRVRDLPVRGGWRPDRGPRARDGGRGRATTQFTKELLTVE